VTLPHHRTCGFPHPAVEQCLSEFRPRSIACSPRSRLPQTGRRTPGRRGDSIAVPQVTPAAVVAPPACFRRLRVLGQRFLRRGSLCWREFLMRAVHSRSHPMIRDYDKPAAAKQPSADGSVTGGWRILRRREGWTDNHQRVLRIYQEEGLQVKRRLQEAHRQVARASARRRPTSESTLEPGLCQRPTGRWPPVADAERGR